MSKLHELCEKGKMKILSILITLLFVLNMNTTVSNAKDIVFSPNIEKKEIILSDKIPKIYMPQKLFIGEIAKLIIKAQPYSTVALITSNMNNGAKDFFGIKLRLGEDLNTVERLVPKNGVLKIEINIPNDEDLVGKLKFFELLVWTDNKEFKDIQLAKIISYKGNEAIDNKLMFDLPPKNSILPGFIPAIPGGAPELLQTMKYIENAKDSDLGDEIYNMNAYNSKSVIIRNLRASDLQNKH